MDATALRAAYEFVHKLIHRLGPRPLLAASLWSRQPALRTLHSIRTAPDDLWATTIGNQDLPWIGERLKILMERVLPPHGGHADVGSNVCTISGATPGSRRWVWERAAKWTTRSARNWTRNRSARSRWSSGTLIFWSKAARGHIDHGYTSTSHSAQGATVDRVIVNVDSMRSHKLVNQQQFYVSISRARYNALVFTDELKTLESSCG